MHAIAHGVYRHRNRVCTESWLWEKNLLLHRGMEPVSAACRSDALPTELQPHPQPQHLCVHKFVHLSYVSKFLCDIEPGVYFMEIGLSVPRRSKVSSICLWHFHSSGLLLLIFDWGFSNIWCECYQTGSAVFCAPLWCSRGDENAKKANMLGLAALHTKIAEQIVFPCFLSVLCLCVRVCVCVCVRARARAHARAFLSMYM